MPKPRLIYPGIKDRALADRFNALAEKIGHPPHLVLAGIVRDYLDGTDGQHVCFDCHVPRPDVRSYSREHIRGDLCPSCRGVADYTLDKMASRAAGLTVVEQPEPEMFRRVL